VSSLTSYFCLSAHCSRCKRYAQLSGLHPAFLELLLSGQLEGEHRAKYIRQNLSNVTPAPPALALLLLQGYFLCQYIFHKRRLRAAVEPPKHKRQLLSGPAAASLAGCTPRSAGPRLLDVLRRAGAPTDTAPLPLSHGMRGTPLSADYGLESLHLPKTRVLVPELAELPSPVTSLVPDTLSSFQTLFLATFLVCLTKTFDPSTESLITRKSLLSTLPRIFSIRQAPVVR